MRDSDKPFYVKATKGHPEGPVNLHRVTADWTETGATWETMASNFDSATLNTIPAQPDVGDVWVAVNLTTQVQAWVNGGEPNYGIMLIPTGEGTHAEYISREGVASQSPRLEVVVGTGPASPATIQVTGTLPTDPLGNSISRTLDRADVAIHQPTSYSLLQLQTGFGKDVMVDGFYNSRNHGDYELKVSSDPGWLMNALVQFDLAAIPIGARVISAQLQLYHTATTAAGTGAGGSVHRVTRDWVEGTKSGGGTADGATWDTWDGTSNWTTAGGDYDPAAVASSAITAATGDWESWDITTLAQGWLDGTFANSGLLLKASGDVNVDFASKEDADPTLHPKLSITYACECGSACLAPQGSGNVLMVVGNDANPVPEDVYKQSLLEAWGYTVQMINDGANQATYDAGISNHDVVYISETLDATTLGSKLGNPPIGIVNEEGWKNDDLGFESANSSNWPVGDSIGITDTSHYITALFPTGPLTIYDADMGGLAIDSTPAPDLQSLADWGSDTGLAVLETGAMTAGGYPTAGRRVMLPFGRDTLMDWPHVNSNGLLIMQRAIEWAEGAGTATTGPLAHWKLDETAGLTAVDSVGGHDGTLTNDPTWSTGQLDGALNFDGGNDYVNVPHDDTLSLTTFSISAWIRPAALSGWQIVVSKGNTTSWNYYMGTDDSEISIGFNNSGSWTEFLTSGAGLATGQWYHLAGTFDDAAGEGKVYLNGALIHTGTTTASPSATSDAVMIGNSPAGDYWPGLLDDVRIYDRVLSDAEVAELATGGGDPPQTVLLVVGDATTLSSKDAGRKALIESWGHTVTVIDDGDSQANIDAATAAVNVVYVTASIVGGTLANKLTGSTTAIVSEFSGKLDNFGFSSSTSATVLSDGFCPDRCPALHHRECGVRPP